ncbi:MAG: hypothetical protein OEM15_09150 [Myxococcales bacterium]|nr:hypothetical protein [Myxococcales bacterium]
MPGSPSMHWLVVVVCGTLAAFGCTADTQGETGALSLELVINGDTEIDEVAWTITQGEEVIKSGTINTSANKATASVEAYGLEPGDGYTITLEAVSTDKETTCKGKAMFGIEVGEVTEVHVMLNCKLPSEFGGVRVDGEFNLCPVLRWADASPMTTSVGNQIDLSAVATDEEDNPITYMWSSGSGVGIANPMAADTTYTCTEVGPDTITILVTDDGGMYCMSMHTFEEINCVPADGDPCEGVICDDTGNECTTAACNPGTGLCETSNVADGTDCDGGAGMCDAGDCVPKDLCMDVVCDDDGNDCTAEVCNPSTGVCETSNVGDGTPCGDGGACMGGTCIEEDLCMDVVCDDTGNDCTVAECNNLTGVCDEMNVPDETACNDDTGVCLSGMCEVGNQCEGVDCSSGNDCVDGGTCNPSNGLCEGGGPEPINTPCDVDGVCDGAGTCVECNDGSQCPDDSNQCTMAACDLNVCGQSNVMNGMVCDLVGMDDGICEDGTCVTPPDCIENIDCDDGNECTVNSCVDGMCVTQPEEDGVTCDAAATPGSCQSGICTPLCDTVTCPDNGIECVTDVCNPANGACEGVNDANDTSCDAGGGPDSGTCDEGSCIASVACPPDPVSVAGIRNACRNSFNQVVSTFPVDLGVALNDCAFANQTFNATVDPVLALDTAFLQAAANTLCDLGTALTQAAVSVAQVGVDAVQGATCTEQLSELSPVPQTVVLDVTVDGTCGAGGTVTVNSGISLELPQVVVPCTAGTAGDTVAFCATGTTPLEISLANPAVQTFVGVSVSGGAIQVVFQCGGPATIEPPPGVTVDCMAPNSVGGPCGTTVGTGDFGETPFPTSDCDFSDGFPGECETVPVALDPETECVTFPVEP